MQCVSQYICYWCTVIGGKPPPTLGIAGLWNVCQTLEHHSSAITPYG